jgi:hypothetical protein
MHGTQRRLRLGSANGASTLPHYGDGLNLPTKVRHSRLDRICGGLRQFVLPHGSRSSAGPNLQCRRTRWTPGGAELSVVANAVWRFTPCPRSDGGVERADVTNRRRHAAGIRLPFRKNSSLDSCFRYTGVADPAKRKRSRFRSHSRPTPAGSFLVDGIGCVQCETHGISPPSDPARIRRLRAQSDMRDLSPHSIIVGEVF